MGLSSRLTHVLILTDLSRSLSHSIRICHVYQACSGRHLLRSFNGPEPGGPESMTRNKREKEADIPWFMQKTNKALDTGLALLHIGTGRPLTRVLQARARK